MTTEAHPAPQAVPNTIRRRRLIAATLGLVMVLGLVLRVGFARMTVRSNSHVEFVDIHGDVFGYLRIGERLYDRRPYTAASAQQVNRGLIRPPGYPAFYVAVRHAYDLIGKDMGKDLRLIVWPQVAISTLAIATVYWLGLFVFRSIVAATIAALIAACSPTGVATPAIAMPDSLLGVMFGLAFCGFLLAMRPLDPTWPRSKLMWHARLTSLAGLALALGAMLKPAPIYWPIAVVPLVLLARGFNRPAFSDIRRLVLPTVIVVGMWTWFNVSMYGVNAYSIVSTRNMRYAVVPKVELATQLGRMPTHDEYAKYASLSTAIEKAFLAKSGVYVEDLQTRISREVREVTRAHPVWTARVWASNVLNQTTSRYKRVGDQLTNGKNKLQAKIRKLYDATDTPAALVTWYGLMFASVPLCLLMRDRAALRPLLLCWVGFAYVILPLGSVSNEGSRLMYAAEPMEATLIAGTMLYLGRMIAAKLPVARSSPR